MVEGAVRPGRQPFPLDAWLSELIARHTREMTRPQFLKAVRALSARYVERRSGLADRSPLDSAGKRAAFAAFYAPLHFLTTREIVRRLGMATTPLATIDDLGCGTGVTAAAWALEFEVRPTVRGHDLNSWALGEARATWASMSLRGHAVRGDIVAALTSLERTAVGAAARAHEIAQPSAIVLGWSLNELDPSARDRAQAALLSLAMRGTSVLVIEPVARRLVPWWPRWADQAAAAGGQVNEWRFDLALPAPLADIDEAARFNRAALTARTVAWNPGPPPAASRLR